MLQVIRRGAEPKQLAFSAALGITIGIFPLDRPFLAFGGNHHWQWALPLDSQRTEECSHWSCIKGCAAEHRQCDAGLAYCCTICTCRAVRCFVPLFQGPG
uniref:Uncharacterized protein n=1 Tax=Zea mays TaxID=4577 RepID=B4FNX6_MAIZE|nr:unknown [Zea mays]